MRRARAFVVLAVALLSVAAAARAELTIDALLAPTLPSGALAVDGGRALAWLEEERGERSVWYATAPAFAPRQLHRFAGDDGLELGELTASADGRWLAFVRGGDEGGSPETNVASDPAGAKATVWLVATDGKGAARAIGAGNEPAISPQGDRIVFVRGGQLWSAPLAPSTGSKGGSKGGEPTQLTELKGRQSTPRFSPDGGRLAFASARGTHGFVGVLDLATKGPHRITWLDPDVDTDLLPTWSPDGRELAFLRLPAADLPAAFLPRRSAAEPWSLRVADAATGRGRELFRAQPGDGSVFHFFETQGTNLWWSADGRVVFPWERSGWHHLWAIPADATSASAAYDLTAGPHEVEHATLAPDGKTIVLTSNELDLDGRTLWRVAAGGGQRIRIDSNEIRTFEFFPTPLADGALVWLQSSRIEPIHLVFMSQGDPGGRPLRPEVPKVAGGWPGMQFTPVSDVIFPSTDGLPIHGQLFLPPNAKAEAKVPAVVYVHGGPVRQMFAAPHFWGYYHRSYMMNQYLATHGVAVLSVNYRSGIGYGLGFREADGVGEAGASEFQDVLGAAAYLRARPEIDGARLGIWGGSYGGYLTAMALARASGTFKAGVDFHGVHDWNLEWPHPDFTRDYVATGQRLDRAFAASPMADLDTWRSPALLIHGDDDHNVPFVETVRLAEELRKRGVPLETLVFPDEVHGFLLHRSWLRAYAATADFFARRLGTSGD